VKPDKPGHVEFFLMTKGKSNKATLKSIDVPRPDSLHVLKFINDVLLASF